MKDMSIAEAAAAIAALVESYDAALRWGMVLQAVRDRPDILVELAATSSEAANFLDIAAKVQCEADAIVATLKAAV